MAPSWFQPVKQDRRHATRPRIRCDGNSVLSTISFQLTACAVDSALLSRTTTPSRVQNANMRPPPRDIPRPAGQFIERSPFPTAADLDRAHVEELPPITPMPWKSRISASITIQKTAGSFSMEISPGAQRSGRSFCARPLLGLAVATTRVDATPCARKRDFRGTAISDFFNMG